MSIKCDECGNEFHGNVCTKCGLELDNEFIYHYKQHVKRNFNDECNGKDMYIGPLSPSMEYYAWYPKKASEKELNRALWRQRRTLYKNIDNYYYIAMVHVKRICTSMRLPDPVMEEALWIVKETQKIKETFFNSKSKSDYRLLGSIKIACQLNNIWINDKEFIINARDYQGEEINLRNSEIKYNIDKEMANIKGMLNLYIQYPNNPNFIDIACRFFQIPQKKISKLYEMFRKIIPIMNKCYKLEGYVLALLYLNFGDEYDITITKMESEFNVARDTIRKRIKELKCIIQ